MKYIDLRVSYEVDNIVYIETIKNTTKNGFINILAEKHQKARACINVLNIETL